MPYITEDDRKKYDPFIDHIVYIMIEKLNDVESKDLPDTDKIVGDLNYVVFSIVKRLIDYTGIRYKILAKLIGTLQCCILEIYRRLAVPYEEKKIKEHGDVE